MLFIAVLLPTLTVAALGQDRDARRRDRDRDDRDRDTRTTDARRHPGYVDGSDFAKLAGDDADLIEVSIEGPLLKMVAKGLGEQQPELADLIGGIVSINAIVIDLPSEAKKDKDGRLADAARDLADRLRGKDWQQLARVREKGDASVVVMAHMEDDAIDGLLVLVVEEGDEFVFVNIAGRIDLAKIAEVGMKLDVPGIQDISRQIMESAPARTRSGTGRHDDDDDDDRGDGRSDRGGR
jgi:hypothetical protein